MAGALTLTIIWASFIAGWIVHTIVTRIHDAGSGLNSPLLMWLSHGDRIAREERERERAKHLPAQRWRELRKRRRMGIAI